MVRAVVGGAVVGGAVEGPARCLGHHETDDQRRDAPGGDDRLGLGADMTARANAPRSAPRVMRTASTSPTPPDERLLDEVGDDLGVGVRLEDVTRLAQLVGELPPVLDDAVVDDGDRAGAVGVRVGVLLGRVPVGRPTGVPDARRALPARPLRPCGASPKSGCRRPPGRATCRRRSRERLLPSRNPCTRGARSRRE